LCNQRIEQKIFHAEIVVDNTTIAAETKAYKPIPVITNLVDMDGNDYIEFNYNQIKPGVKQIVVSELKRIADDPALKHLIKKE
jgi:hypothetical protein